MTEAWEIFVMTKTTRRVSQVSWTLENVRGDSLEVPRKQGPTQVGDVEIRLTWCPANVVCSIHARAFFWTLVKKANETALTVPRSNDL